MKKQIPMAPLCPWKAGRCLSRLNLWQMANLLQVQTKPQRSIWRRGTLQTGMRIQTEMQISHM